jgi:hypothetical protein
VWERNRRGFKAPREARGAFPYGHTKWSHKAAIELRAMAFDRAGKALANEDKYPFIVEVAVAASGLDVVLNSAIVGFHRSRRIPPRFGRTIWRNRQHYYRWCFSDLPTARAFVEQFGGAFYKTTGT